MAEIKIQEKFNPYLGMAYENTTNAFNYVVVSNLLSVNWESSSKFNNMKNEINVIDETKNQFLNLLAKWEQERAFMSNPTDVFSCPAYKKIVDGLGEDALPYIREILENDKKQSSFWFKALKKITGRNDVIDPSHYGNDDQMANDWLRFLKDAKV